MMNRQQRINEARAARDRWSAAIEANRPHDEINMRWLSYVALAEQAGPYTMIHLESEVAVPATVAVGDIAKANWPVDHEAGE